MSSKYGFFGDIKLDEWSTGTTRAQKLLGNGDTEGAYNAAKTVADSYMKHRQGTGRWQKFQAIVAILFIIIGVITGLASGEWVIAIVIAVVGLIITGLIANKVTDKRIAVDNAFYDSYESLLDAIKDLKG